MALIAAIFGSVLGVVLGALSMVVFNVTLLGAFGLYVAVALGSIVLCATALFLRADPTLAADGAYETALDDAWETVEAQTRPLSSREAEFQEDLDAPLSASERATGEKAAPKAKGQAS